MDGMRTEKKGLEPLSWLLIGILVGALATALWALEKTIPTFSFGSPTGSHEENALTHPLLAVSSQPAGGLVVVRSVAVPPPGVWVAVHENVDNAFVGVLGASRVRFQSTNVPIELLRPTEVGKQYSIVLYRDDGDDQFSLERDSVYVDFETGRRVEATFEVTS